MNNRLAGIDINPNNANVFAEVGEALFGRRWQSDLARETGLSQPTVSLIARNGNFSAKSYESLHNYVMGLTSTVSDTVMANVIEPVAIDMEKIMTDIKLKFSDLDSFISMAINKTVRSLIISGGAGIGKSHTVFEMFDNEGLVPTEISGTISAFEIYRALYEQKDGGVVVFDDCDSIFSHNVDETINILKAALNTGERPRTISYLKARQEIKDGEVPSSFVFNGQVIFITNIDFRGQIAKGTKASPHFQALLSRSIYVDLGLRTYHEKIARLRQGIYEMGIIDDLFGDENHLEVGEMFLEFIEANKDKLKIDDIDFRFIDHCSKIYVEHKENWKRLVLFSKGYY